MKNLTKSQRSALEDVRDHNDPWHRVAKYSSARDKMSHVVSSLIKEGFAVRTSSGKWFIQPKGIEALT